MLPSSRNLDCDHKPVGGDSAFEDWLEKACCAPREQAAAAFAELDADLAAGGLQDVSAAAPLQLGLCVVGLATISCGHADPTPHIAVSVAPSPQ